jgi:hypothetical protein
VKASFAWFTLAAASAFEAAALGSAVAVSWFCRSIFVLLTAVRAFVASASAWSDNAGFRDD